MIEMQTGLLVFIVISLAILGFFVGAMTGVHMTFRELDRLMEQEYERKHREEGGRDVR